jgi:hypothetical protein
MLEFDEDEGQEVFEDTPQHLETLKRIFAQVLFVLERMLVSAPAIEVATPSAVISKLSELQFAYEQIVAAEETFYAEHGSVLRTADIDLAANRAEIRGQLDRVRAATSADTVSGETERCAACGATLSI